MSKKNNNKQKQQGCKKGSSYASRTKSTPLRATSKAHAHSNMTKKELLAVRMFQRDICYVAGLTHELCTKGILGSKQWFGQFGRIRDIVIIENVNCVRNNWMCAHIKYFNEPSATKAVKAMNGKVIEEGRVLEANYGTTRYCEHFIDRTECPKNRCPYRHSWCDPKEVMISPRALTKSRRDPSRGQQTAQKAVAAIPIRSPLSQRAHQSYQSIVSQPRQQTEAKVPAKQPVAQRLSPTTVNADTATPVTAANGIRPDPVFQRSPSKNPKPRPDRAKPAGPPGLCPSAPSPPQKAEQPQDVREILETPSPASSSSKPSTPGIHGHDGGGSEIAQSITATTVNDELDGRDLHWHYRAECDKSTDFVVPQSTALIAELKKRNLKLTKLNSRLRTGLAKQQGVLGAYKEKYMAIKEVMVRNARELAHIKGVTQQLAESRKVYHSKYTESVAHNQALIKRVRALELRMQRMVELNAVNNAHRQSVPEVQRIQCVQQQVTHHQQASHQQHGAYRAQLKQQSMVDYQLWHWQDVYNWMMAIAGGRLRQYSPELQSSLRRENVDGAKIKMLGDDDLARMGITDARDRQIALHSISKLRSQLADELERVASGMVGEF